MRLPLGTMLLGALLYVTSASAFNSTGSSDSVLSDRNWGDEAEPPAMRLPTPPPADTPAVTPSYLMRSGPSIVFAPGSATLGADAQAIVAEQAERIKADRRLVVTLVGYTDDLGSSSYGLALAHRRAVAVANALLARGVGVRQMRLRAYGQESTKTGTCLDETRSGDIDGADAANTVCNVVYSRVEFRYPVPARSQ